MITHSVRRITVPYVAGCCIKRCMRWPASSNTAPPSLEGQNNQAALSGLFFLLGMEEDRGKDVTSHSADHTDDLTWSLLLSRISSPSPGTASFPSLTAPAFSPLFDNAEGEILVV